MKTFVPFFAVLLLSLVCGGRRGLAEELSPAPVPDSTPSQPAETAAPSTPTPQLVTSISVYVLGAVARPGMVTLPNAPYRKPRLLNAIRAAGGLREGEPEPAARAPEMAPATKPAEAVSDSASHSTMPSESGGRDDDVNVNHLPGFTARLLRDDGPRTVNLYGLRDNNVSANISLRDGDVIVVAAPEPQFVTADGAVLRPGKHGLQPRTSTAAFLKAVGIAGSAALHEAWIERDSQRLVIDGEALADGRAQGPVLKAGDILHVPRGEALVEVRGAVRFPGLRSFRKEMRFLDAIGLCGGWGNLADINALPTVRDQAWGTSRVLKVTLQALFQNRNFPETPILTPGWRLTIPQRQAVTIVGAKTSPYFVSPHLGLRKAVVAAGAAETAADFSHIVIMGGLNRPRGVVVDLTGIGSARAMEKLQHGDVIWIPQRKSIAVCGAVLNPRSIALKRPLTLLESIKAGGGFLTTAARDSVAVLRPEGVRLTMIKADLGSESGGGYSPTLTLREGDIVVVPFREPPDLNRTLVRSPVTLTPLLSFLVAPPK